MTVDKTLTASSESEAIEKVESIFTESYVHCFGESGTSYDIAVYDSVDDFEADANDGDNYRIKARYSIRILEE